ncbi:hypothetical protein ACHWQZ_G003874 [Mnemiopsis leidyi]
MGKIKNAPRGLEFLNPMEVRYTNETISAKFQDGRTVDSTIAEIKNGLADINDIPTIKVVQNLGDGTWWSLNNRRLHVFRSLYKTGHLTTIPCQNVSKKTNYQTRWENLKSGGKTVRVRPSHISSECDEPHLNFSLINGYNDCNKCYHVDEYDSSNECNPGNDCYPSNDCYSGNKRFNGNDRYPSNECNMVPTVMSRLESINSIRSALSDLSNLIESNQRLLHRTARQELPLKDTSRVRRVSEEKNGVMISVDVNPSCSRSRGRYNRESYASKVAKRENRGPKIIVRIP